MDGTKKAASKTKSSSSSKSHKDAKSQYTSDFLRQKLLEHFKHKDFKSNLQKDAIKEIMQGSRDVYISMPTGSGKSLCYQLPGLLYDKITIVFSPLIALIKDQMDHLTSLNICAESLNSKMTMRERDRVINDLKSIRPNTKFLYITPEQAATDFFRAHLEHMVKYNKLALVAVDECHCVSEMGHQFRKDYLKLGELRKKYPKIKWIALTATASKDVTDDVFKQLALKEPKQFKSPCFRKNLVYDIIYKNSIQDDYIHLKEFVLKCLKSKNNEEKSNKAPCGIIYCRTREAVERVAVGLCKQNIVTKSYHAGLNDKDRKQVQEDWTAGKFPVISATNSFGMGVDKSSVRFVVHWDCPQNIAAYYQESGRAGRDGKTSYCRLYYCRQEVKSISFLLNMDLQKKPDCVKAKRSVKEFEKLVDHCESLRCRHLLFSAYFGDKPPDCKKNDLCDVCKDGKKAEKKLEIFHQLSMSGFTSKMDVDYDTSDLYEGGRNANREAEATYSQENDDDDYGSGSESTRNIKARKEATNFIQQEFQRRKQKIDLAKKLEETQTRANGIRVRSSIHTTTKISGLDVKKREGYLDYLMKALTANVEKAKEKPAHQLKACDFEDIAAQLEYNCFTKNHVLAMYTRSTVAERMRIDRSTKSCELLAEIKDHVPKKRTAHGGSAEAMQKDLESFMKQHNLSSEEERQHSNNRGGFQTARQINNKLREPKRMKKDPLTQVTINTFFSPSKNKREPEEVMNSGADEKSQQPKRRKVDEPNVAEIRIKPEPIDETFDGDATVPIGNTEESVNCKSEPLDYGSDSGTEKDSDDEEELTIGPDQQWLHGPSPQLPHAAANPIPSSELAQERLQSPEHEFPQKTHTESLQQTAEQNEQENRRIKDEPMEVVEPEDEIFEADTIMNFKAEQNEYNSDASTDKPSDDEEETITANMQLNEEGIFNTAPEVLMNGQQAVADVLKLPKLDQTMKAEPCEPLNSDNIFVDPSVGRANEVRERPHRNQTTSVFAPQPSTSTGYSGKKMGAFGRTFLTPNDGASKFERKQFTRRSDHTKFNPTQSSTLASESMAQEAAMAQEKATGQEEPVAQEEVNSNDDDGDYYIDDAECIEDLGDEIEQLEIQYKEEFEQFKKIEISQLNLDEIKAYTKQADELRRKKEKIFEKQAREAAKETDKEREKMRDEFINQLFTSNFDITTWDRQINDGVTNQSRPSTSKQSSMPMAEPIEKKLTYNELMKKSNVKPEQQNINESKKMIIQRKVDRFLKPYLKNGTITEKTFGVLRDHIISDHLERHIFDSAKIQEAVDELVKTVELAKNKHKVNK